VNAGKRVATAQDREKKAEKLVIWTLVDGKKKKIT